MFEILEVLSNALSALVGGLCAILGGMLVRRQATLEQNREFLKRIIREIYQLTIETEDWAQQETIKMNQYIAHGSQIEVDNLKSKSKHIRMLLRLHFKTSKDICEELDKYELLFFNGMQLAYSAPAKFKRPEHQETIMDASKLYFVALVKIREYLENEIQQLFKIS